jgi:hypothetical protein
MNTGEITFGLVSMLSESVPVDCSNQSQCQLDHERAKECGGQHGEDLSK